MTTRTAAEQSVDGAHRLERQRRVGKAVKECVAAQRAFVGDLLGALAVCRTDVIQLHRFLTTFFTTDA